MPHVTMAAPGRRSVGSRKLCFAEIYRRGLALLAALELEGELLALPQIANPRSLNGRNMDEDILGAVVGLNKTIALLRVEPLYRTRSHSSFPSTRFASRQICRLNHISILGSTFRWLGSSRRRANHRRNTILVQMAGGRDAVNDRADFSVA